MSKDNLAMDLYKIYLNKKLTNTYRILIIISGRYNNIQYINFKNIIRQIDVIGILN